MTREMKCGRKCAHCHDAPAEARGFCLACGSDEALMRLYKALRTANDKIAAFEQAHAKVCKDLIAARAELRQSQNETARLGRKHRRLERSIDLEGRTVKYHAISARLNDILASIVIDAYHDDPDDADLRRLYNLCRSKRAGFRVA